MPNKLKKLCDSIKTQRRRQRSTVVCNKTTSRRSVSMFEKSIKNSKNRYPTLNILEQHGNILKVQILDTPSSASSGTSKAKKTRFTKGLHQRLLFTPTSTDSEAAAAPRPLEDYFGDEEGETSEERTKYKRSMSDTEFDYGTIGHKLKLSVSNLQAHNLKMAESNVRLAKNATQREKRSRQIAAQRKPPRASKKADNENRSKVDGKENAPRRELRPLKVVSYCEDLKVSRKRRRQPLGTVTANQIDSKREGVSTLKNDVTFESILRKSKELSQRYLEPPVSVKETNVVEDKAGATKKTRTVRGKENALPAKRGGRLVKNGKEEQVPKEKPNNLKRNEDKLKKSSTKTDPPTGHLEADKPDSATPNITVRTEIEVAKPSTGQSSANKDLLLSRSMCFDKKPAESPKKKGKKTAGTRVARKKNVRPTKAQPPVECTEPDSEATTEIIEMPNNPQEQPQRKSTKVDEIANMLARKRASAVADDDFEISTKRLEQFKTRRKVARKNDANLSKDSFFEGSTSNQAPVVNSPAPKKRRQPKRTGTRTKATKPQEESKIVDAPMELAEQLWDNYVESNRDKVEAPKRAEKLVVPAEEDSGEVRGTPKTVTRKKSSVTNSYLRSSYNYRRKYYYPTENGIKVMKFAGFLKHPSSDPDRVCVSTLTAVSLGYVGYLHIPKGQTKSPVMAKSNLHYNVLKGEGEVTIHNIKASVKACTAFDVPKGAFYSISNTGDILLSLNFLKERSESGEEK